MLRKIFGLLTRLTSQRPFLSSPITLPDKITLTNNKERPTDFPSLQFAGIIDGNFPRNENCTYLECEFGETMYIQWAKGEWGPLAKAEFKNIEEHPERATLALLSASAMMQLGDTDGAKQLIERAEQWGARKLTAAKILAAGVHNNLARANTLVGRNNLASDHFIKAVSLSLLENRDHHLADNRTYEQRRQLLGASEHDTNGPTAPVIEVFPVDESPTVLFQDCKKLEKAETGDGMTDLNGREVVFDNLNGEIPRPLFYRPASKGDRGVLQQIFQEKQYEFGWLPQGKDLMALATLIREKGSTPAIIDGGANIGASAIWFAERYKGAVVLAIEPEADNCQLFQKNCAGQPVRLFQGGLSDSRKELFLDDPGQSDWGYRVSATGDIKVQCIGLTDIMQYCADNSLTPLLLKLDIEGAEEAVFSGNTDWINDIPVIIIELHDWLFPQGNTSQNFMRAVSKYGLQIFTRGENMFCFNRDSFKKIKFEIKSEN